MIDRKELKEVAKAKLKDAEVLYQNKRYDSAYYLVGYAVELALKARICRTLKWSGFPETGGEFKNLQSFKTHNLEVLLKLSGVEEKIRTNYISEWSIVLEWNPELRYGTTGTINNQKAEDMIAAVTSLFTALR